MIIRTFIFIVLSGLAFFYAAAFTDAPVSAPEKAEDPYAMKLTVLKCALVEEPGSVLLPEVLSAHFGCLARRRVPPAALLLALLWMPPISSIK